jgi:hypothetical protein
MKILLVYVILICCAECMNNASQNYSEDFFNETIYSDAVIDDRESEELPYNVAPEISDYERGT